MFSARMFLTFFIATHVSIFTSDISSKPRRFTFTDLQNAPLPDFLIKKRIRVFGEQFEPRYILGAKDLI